MEATKLDRSVTRLTHLEAADDGYVGGDPATRIALVWPITRETWAFMRPADAQRRLQRNIARLVRREDAPPA